MCVRFGIKFDTIGTRFGCMENHIGYWVNKNGSAYAIGFKFGDNFFQIRFVLFCIPTGIGGNSIVRIGHKRNLCRLYFEHQFDEAGDRVPFDVELGFYQRINFIHIAIADMAFVGTRMDRNAMCPEQFAINGSF